MATQISRDQLALQLRLGVPVRLVEVLGPDWWADAHLPGALNLPASVVERMAPEALPDQDERIVVYASRTCAGEAVQAAATLEALGYRNVQIYGGGKEEWVEAGLPVERGPLSS